MAFTSGIPISSSLSLLDVVSVGLVVDGVFSSLLMSCFSAIGGGGRVSTAGAEGVCAIDFFFDSSSGNVINRPGLAFATIVGNVEDPFEAKSGAHCSTKSKKQG